MVVVGGREGRERGGEEGNEICRSEKKEERDRERMERGKKGRTERMRRFDDLVFLKNDKKEIVSNKIILFLFLFIGCVTQASVSHTSKKKNIDIPQNNSRKTLYFKTLYLRLVTPTSPHSYLGKYPPPCNRLFGDLTMENRQKLIHELGAIKSRSSNVRSSLNEGEWESIDRLFKSQKHSSRHERRWGKDDLHKKILQSGFVCAVTGLEGSFEEKKVVTFRRLVVDREFDSDPYEAGTTNIMLDRVNDMKAAFLEFKTRPADRPAGSPVGDLFDPLRVHLNRLVDFQS